jgi:hypothetical protein
MEHRQMTHAEIARELGVSVSLIGYIERTALRKVRRALEARGIRAEDLDHLGREIALHPLAGLTDKRSAA